MSKTDNFSNKPPNLGGHQNPAVKPSGELMPPMGCESPPADASKKAGRQQQGVLPSHKVADVQSVPPGENYVSVATEKRCDGSPVVTTKDGTATTHPGRNPTVKQNIEHENHGTMPSDEMATSSLNLTRTTDANEKAAGQQQDMPASVKEADDQTVPSGEDFISEVKEERRNGSQVVPTHAGTEFTNHKRVMNVKENKGGFSLWVPHEKLSDKACEGNMRDLVENQIVPTFVERDSSVRQRGPNISGVPVSYGDEDAMAGKYGGFQIVPGDSGGKECGPHMTPAENSSDGSTYRSNHRDSKSTYDNVEERANEETILTRAASISTCSSSNEPNNERNPEQAALSDHVSASPNDFPHVENSSCDMSQPLGISADHDGLSHFSDECPSFTTPQALGISAEPSVSYDVECPDSDWVESSGVSHAEDNGTDNSQALDPSADHNLLHCAEYFGSSPLEALGAAAVSNSMSDAEVTDNDSSQILVVSTHTHDLERFNCHVTHASNISEDISGVTDIENADFSTLQTSGSTADPNAEGSTVSGSNNFQGSQTGLSSVTQSGHQAPSLNLGNNQEWGQSCQASSSCLDLDIENVPVQCSDTQNTCALICLLLATLYIIYVE